jgi:hypothetical protein
MNLEELMYAPKTVSTQCKWRPWFESLSAEEQDTIAKAFADPQLETTQVTRALKTYGCPSSSTTIRTHRRGECKSCN